MGIEFNLIKWLCAGLIIAAVFIIFFWAILGRSAIDRAGQSNNYQNNNYRNSNYQNRNIAPINPPCRPQIPMSCQSNQNSYSSMPNYHNKPSYHNTDHQFFHGTSVEAAEEIWNTNLWKSDMEPAMLWMADYIEYAKDFALRNYENNGRIIVLFVDPKIKMKDLGDGRYYVIMSPSNNNKDYYFVDGVDIAWMLDLDENLLKKK